MNLEALTTSMVDGWWWPTAVGLLVVLLVRISYRRVASQSSVPTFTSRDVGAVLSPAPACLPLLFLPTAFAWASFDSSGTPGAPTLTVGLLLLLVTAVGGKSIAQRS